MDIDKEGLNRGTRENADVPVTTEEKEALRLLLREAYPDAGGKITREVMAKIRQECPAGDTEKRSEKTAARRRMNGLIMKWGGLAACMAIISAAIIVASPSMDISSDTAMTDMAAVEAVLMDCVTDDAADMKEMEPVEDTVAETAGMPVTVASSNLLVKQPDTGANEPAETVVVEEGERMLYSAKTKKAVLVENSAAYDAAYADSVTETVSAEEERREANEALVEIWIEKGYFTKEEYESWMDVNMYRSAADWDAEAVMEFFRIPADPE